MRLRTSPVMCLALATACGGGPRDELEPTASAADDELADGDSTGDAGEELAPPERNGDTGQRLDLPPSDATSCTKIDFLFVIDDSGSMQDEQERLIDGFPGFIEAVEESISQYDYHLMAISTAFDDADPADCRDAVGAGLIDNGDGDSCGVADEGKQLPRYVDGEDEDLSDVFSCLADMGVGSAAELPIWTMAQALTTQSLPDGCNTGFLRDDAILVVTIITDEEDSPSDSVVIPALDGSCEPADADPNSAGDPTSWADAIISAKNGDAEAAVVLSLLGDCDIGGSCEGIVLDPLNPAAPITGAEPAPRIRQFTESFTYGSVGPVCSADYAPFFLEAVSVIDSACDDFVPPG